jgi:hypothetical protein
MVDIRLRARRRVRSLGVRGKLPSVERSLSVKSIQSWSYEVCMSRDDNPKWSREVQHTLLATPKFSTAGIL